MYKSLLIVSLFSLSASAMKPEEESINLRNTASQLAVPAIGTGISLVVCAPTCITGPVGTTACLGTVTAFTAAFAYINSKKNHNKKTESK